MPWDGRDQHASTLSLRSRTGSTCSVLVIRDQQETNSLVGTCAHMQHGQPPFSLSFPIEWVCLEDRGLTAVVVTLDHHPDSQDRGHAGDQQWQRSGLHCLASEPQGNRRGAKKERYHAPCPDCGHAEGRAFAGHVASSRRHPRRGVASRLDAWA